MLKQRPLRLTFFLLSMLIIVLVACRDNNVNEVVDDLDKDHNEHIIKKARNEVKEREPEPQSGGTVVGAIHTTSTGQFNPLFYEEVSEKNIIEFVFETLFKQNKELAFETTGLAEDFELNEDQTKMTVYLREGIKWHDGEDFTAEDVVFTYQVIADPDYEDAGGVQTNPYGAPLLGFEDYKSGATDEFQGVVAEDDHTVVFHFAEPTIQPQYIANSYIIPKHIFADMPIAEIPQAEASRIPGSIIGTGPFIFSEMVEDEQYVLEKNEDYWQGTPYLDSIIWRIVNQVEIPRLLETEDIDFVGEPSGIAASAYQSLNELDHLNIIEQPDFNYHLLGFKHHHRTNEDVEEGLIEPDHWLPNEKLPKEVRQAIAYAIDREKLIGRGHGEGLLHGQGTTLESPIFPLFWAYDEEAAIQHTYDPDQATEILDDAGYTMGDDGWRNDPDGNEWILNLDYPLGQELREQAAQLIMDDLTDIGIQVNLRPAKEVFTYFRELTNDNTDWDLYLIGWSLASGDPNPLGMWGSHDAYNFSRWNNPTSDELLFNAISAPEAFDQAYREQQYSEWITLFSEDLPAFILFAENKLWPYNMRIHGIDPLPHTMNTNPHLWWVTDAN